MEKLGKAGMKTQSISKNQKFKLSEVDLNLKQRITENFLQKQTISNETQHQVHASVALLDGLDKISLLGFLAEGSIKAKDAGTA